MIDPKFVEARIREGIEGVVYLKLEDLTGTQDHYQAMVVSNAFAGKMPVARHKMVYAALGELMDGPVHALALRTWTEEQWQANADNHEDGNKGTKS